MLSINTNIGSMIAANQLNTLNTQSQKLSEQATTGKRINHAGDDPAAMAQAIGMHSQLIGNEAAQKNIGRGKDMLSTQEGMMSQINGIFERMKTLATDAADETMSADDRAKSNTELQEQIKEIDRIAKTTEYNGIKLGDGSVASINLQVGANNTADDKIAASLTDFQTSAMNITGGTIATAAGALTFLDNLKLDIDDLGTKLSGNGALQNRLDFAGKNLVNMNTNLAKSLSTIEDADMAKIAAEQAKNTTLQQLGIKMLGTSNQQPMNYLSLFA